MLVEIASRIDGQTIEHSSFVAAEPKMLASNDDRGEVIPELRERFGRNRGIERQNKLVSHWVVTPTVYRNERSIAKPEPKRNPTINCVCGPYVRLSARNIKILC